MSKAFIREIFLSIQGEGPYLGEEQLFIRFCGCNLHCRYCDTDFEISKAKEYSPEELLREVNSFGKNLMLSLTGGEPLVSVEFLKEFLPLARAEGHRIYLETNATLADNLKEIINSVDIVSADIKLASATGEVIPWWTFDDFFAVSKGKDCFAKLVFNSDLTDEEIEESVKIAKRYNIPIILQPEMRGNEFAVTKSDMEKIFKKFHSAYKYIRLIPQVHKFLDVR